MPAPSRDVSAATVSYPSSSRWEADITVLMAGVNRVEANAVDIDGNVKYNTARFINHSCDPNCETDVIRGHIWVIALRDIKKGEELAYNYNYEYEDYEDHKCRCGSNRCVG